MNRIQIEGGRTLESSEIATLGKKACEEYLRAMGAGVKTGTSVDVDVLRDKLRDALAKSGGVSCMVDTYRVYRVSSTSSCTVICMYLHRVSQVMS